VSDDVLTPVENAVGRIRLDRPEALHALTTAMCERVLAALDVWEDDPAVQLVLIDHAQGRGFCAGGDIRMLADSGARDGVEARRFFHAEYRMNHRLFSYAKPIVAVMDGITMGGGVGISLPARFRIATERTRFAMPETGIGLFPDVGGGWYFSRLPGRMGEYLALTGHRLGGAECVALGLATHYISSARVEQVKTEVLAQADAAAIDGDPLPEAAILQHRGEIDRLFAGDTVETIFAALGRDGGEWAQEQLAILRTKSPQALKVSLKLIRDGRAMPSFADEMGREYAVACRVVRRPDFAEGVRAVIVDRDNAPRWNPPTLEGVDEAIIAEIFEPLAQQEAWSPQ
jgi:enoyl-CoA hydratase